MTGSDLRLERKNLENARYTEQLAKNHIETAHKILSLYDSHVYAEDFKLMQIVLGTMERLQHAVEYLQLTEMCLAKAKEHAKQ